MTSRHGLGRGLGALLSSSPETTTKPHRSSCRSPRSVQIRINPEKTLMTMLYET